MKPMTMWSLSEFRVLLDDPTASHDELARELPLRAANSVKTVRSFLHGWHRGLNTSGLNQIMLRELDAQRGTLICPKCRARM